MICGLCRQYQETKYQRAIGKKTPRSSANDNEPYLEQNMQSKPGDDYIVVEAFVINYLINSIYVMAVTW
jgi:hypothetical protein